MVCIKPMFSLIQPSIMAIPLDVDIALTFSNLMIADLKHDELPCVLNSYFFVNKW